VLTLVHQVRRRLFGNDLLAQGANASSAALFVLILLLLLGTQVLSWYWIVLVPALAAAAGLFRARRRMPAPYAVAQMVDARMGLADTLSTALYFSQAPEGPGEMAPSVRRHQHEQAERLAATVDARRAAPYSVPRTIYLVAALALVASTLFAVRYGLNRKLDLKPPLASMLQQQFGWNQKKDPARANRRKAAPKPGDPEDAPDAGQVPDQKGAAQPDPTGGNEQAAADPGNTDQKGGVADKKKSDSPANGAGEDQEAQAEKGNDSQGNDSANATPQNGKGDQSQSGGKQDSNNAGDNSSWMNKLKDAFQNLMSRANPQKGGQGQDPSNQDKQQGKGQQSAGKQQSGKDSQPSGDQAGDAQDGQSGEDGKSQQDPDGKSAGKNEGQQSSKQPGSGIGSQDGDKSIKQAQQLEAMGKLSELYGKRAASITGEATVEVQSTSQQLRTQYVQRGAQHSQSGAEIDRDVIPLALQGYVERYFEQMRKQAPPAPAGTKAGAAKTAAPAAPADKKQ
jgi:hypothetical protein